MTPEDGLPFSQACENNKTLILAVLRSAFADCAKVLEIGSGTGQHACYFAEYLNHLLWQPTELAASVPVLQQRCRLYAGSNLLSPAELDVCAKRWPVTVPDGVFTANTFHIMPFPAVQACFKALGDLAATPGTLAVYGPFNYNGEFTSESNARFHQWLAERDSRSGIRDFEAVNEMAGQAGYALLEDHPMPANNRLLVWRR
ncbi:MAG: DUF938 domain-containing protein [Pseudomonadota bacterium]